MATVLIVDDQRFARSYLGALLAQAGHRVVEASDGMEALDIVRESPPDLVVSDLLMPAMDGYELTRELRRDAVLARIPVIFLTAEYVEAEARLLGQELGVSAFLVKPADPRRFMQAVAAALASGPVSAPEAGTLDAARQGEHIRLLTSKLYEKVLGLEQEIEKRKQIEGELGAANAQLLLQATHDALTSLPNRGQWEECLAREISRARRSGERLAVMMIDVDYFKRFNDDFGHMAGDEVIRAVGKHLRAQVRSEDSLCRYGGDEFAIMLVNADAGLSEKRAQQLRAGVSHLRIEHDGRSIDNIRLSIGIAMFPHDGDSPEVLVKAADSALYAAKRLGRDRVAFA